MAKKEKLKDPVQQILPPKQKKDRHPQVTELGGTNPFGTDVQCWDQDLADRLKAAGAKMGVDDYDPVVALAEMGLDSMVEDSIRFKCHQEVAKYVRLKRQIEPTIAIQQNVYNLPPEKRRERIQELTQRLNIEEVKNG